MPDAQAEPFHVALATLRERLRTGVYRPGVRITAVDLADELRLSNTPVREALARPAGEGLVGRAAAKPPPGSDSPSQRTLHACFKTDIRRRRRRE